MRRRLAAVPLIAPSPPTPGAPQRIGTAFDRLCRLLVRSGEPRLGVAATGIWMMVTGGVRVPRRLERSAEDQLIEGLGRAGLSAHVVSAFLQDHGLRLARQDELLINAPASARLEVIQRELARDCVVLAAFEHVGRSGRIGGPDSPFRRNGMPRTAAELRAIATEEEVSQVDVLAGPWQGLLRTRADATCVHNPAFAGSPLVGGADADLVLGGTLIEIKCTKHRRLSAHTLRQLAVYVALDFSDAHAIRAVGVYLARYGTLMKWPIERYLKDLHGAPISLGAFRVRAIRGLLAEGVGGGAGRSCRAQLEEGLPRVAAADELPQLLRELRRRSRNRRGQTLEH